jgi:putative nucleotidyltransferase with HDIG domain
MSDLFAAPTLTLDLEEDAAHQRFDRGDDPARGAAEPARVVGLLAVARAARNRVLEVLSLPRSRPGELTLAVESDPALVLAVLREGRRAVEGGAAPMSVTAALERLSSDQIREIVLRLPVFDVLGPRDRLSSYAERLRYHALAVHRIAAHLHTRTGTGIEPGTLTAVALLHDFGKLGLAAAVRRYPELARLDVTVDERVTIERQHLGVDHARVGGRIARRLGLADSIADAIESHHDESAIGTAAVVRVADMLSHHLTGDAIDGRQLMRAAHGIGLETDQLASTLEELPLLGERRIERVDLDLSTRQVEVVRELAKGRLYREIAEELGVAESTVRSHLHAVYKKLGVANRAQAVLLAAEQGWL